MNKIKTFALVAFLGILAGVSQSEARGLGNCVTSTGAKGTLVQIQQQITSCSSPTSCIVVQPSIIKCQARGGRP